MTTNDDAQVEIGLLRAELAALKAEPQSLSDVIDLLIDCRKAAGLTQTDIAQRMKVGQPVVSDIERYRRRSNIKLSSVESYAKALGFTVSLRLMRAEQEGEADE